MRPPASPARNRGLTPGEIEAYASIATTISSPQRVAYSTDALLTMAQEAVVALCREAQRAREGWARAEVMCAGLSVAHGHDVEAQVATLSQRLSLIRCQDVTWDQAAEILDGAAPKPPADDVDVRDPGDEA